MKYTSPPDRQFYYAQVWEIVRQVPAGRVTTYGQVAGYIPPPTGMSQVDYKAWGARWVGGAMAACPENVPWHRVINAQGKISLPARSGQERQRELLEAEEIKFDDRERIDLKVYGWEGPGATRGEAPGLAQSEEGRDEV
ncbi:MAG TPA: MGMT family protein [Anaerolineales bacterium]|nr:MGMT family protein [Anaerolineales bacterium]